MSRKPPVEGWVECKSIVVIYIPDGKGGVAEEVKLTVVGWKTLQGAIFYDDRATIAMDTAKAIRISERIRDRLVA